MSYKEFSDAIVHIASVTDNASALSLDELIAAEPKVEALLRAVRKRIGTQLKTEREARQLSLRDVERLSRRKVTSSNLSRVESGDQWSGTIATRTAKLLASQVVSS